MLFELVDLLQKKRRFVYIVLFVVADFCLISVCTQVLQAHRADIVTRIHNRQSAQKLAAYQNDTLDMTVSLDRFSIGMEVGMLRSTIAAADGVAHAEHAL